MELRGFSKLWKGGFFAADPLNPMSRSNLNALGFMSVHHVIYLTCIKPYVTRQTFALEIGPGRGAWTKALLNAREVWCLDALSAKHNNFWKYVGQAPHVRYIQVEDFSCRMLPENTFDFLFSYDVFCHISLDGILEYMKNIRPKLKHGAHCFIMVADYEKFNRAIRDFDNLSIYSVMYPKRRPLQWGKSLLQKLVRRRMGFPPMDVNVDDQPRPGRWYHAGVERTCEMLNKLGYTIIDPPTTGVVAYEYGTIARQTVLICTAVTVTMPPSFACIVSPRGSWLPKYFLTTLSVKMILSGSNKAFSGSVSIIFFAVSGTKLDNRLLIFWSRSMAKCANS